MAADYIVDIGPGAGEHGGEVVATWNRQSRSWRIKTPVTGAYLSGRMQIPVPEAPRGSVRAGLKS